MITANTNMPTNTIACVTTPLRQSSSVVASAPGMSNRLKYADLSFSRKLSSSPLSPSKTSTSLYPKPPKKTMGMVSTNRHATLPSNGSANTFCASYAKISPALYSLYVANVDAKPLVLLLTDSAVTEPTNVDEEAVALGEAFAGRGEAGETPAGSMDAAANSAAPPTAVAASVFAGPRRGRTRVSSDEARFGRRSVSVGPSPLVRSARIEVGFQGSASSSASPASADARHDTRTARRPVGRHDTRDTTRARPTASVDFLLTTDAETSARLGRVARAGAIGRAPGTARSVMAARAVFASAEEGYVTRARNRGEDRTRSGSSKLRLDLNGLIAGTQKVGQFL